MPAASNKTEMKSSPEAMDTSKQILIAVDKKLRNLEKRKGKLDVVRNKQAAGETLEREQKDALQHYEEVVVTLDFIRDMQKQFLTVAAECEKLQKKHAKREKQERSVAEVKRVAEILEIQATLDSLGTDTVRQHFKTGKFGAVVLTEDNLLAFDELYQLISPSREGEGDFADKLTACAEHVISLVEGRERAVGSSTYKELLELIRLVSSCGYFEKAREAQEAQTTEAEAAEEVEEAGEEEAQEQQQEVQEEPVADCNIQNNATEELEPDSSHLSQSAAAAVMEETHYYVQSHAAPVSAPAIFTPVVSQAQPPQPKIKPLPEIMSAVRGKFNFLQDSEIELDSPQHVDPAVVAAQPMMRPPSVGSQQPQMMSTAVFPTANLDSHEPQDPLSLSQQSLDYSGSSQTFAQSLNVSGGLFQGPPPSVEDQVKVSSVQPPPPAQQPQVPPPHMLSQSRGPDVPPAQFELPPSIPMPPGSQQQQESSQLSQEKKFQLNASATEFQSMYSTLPPTMQPPPPQPPQPQPQTTPQDTRPLGPPPSAVPAAEFSSAPNFAQAAGDFSQGSGFQGGFQPRGGRGGPGGFRGQRGGRGGNNAPNMQNGFNPRAQNGNSRPGGSRGGQSFQGFPPRNDYRPDGFQGYNANGFGGPGSGSPYQKRGGAGGASGFPRGGGGNNRGAGGMRGGPRPNGPPGAGVNRGGMSRPGNQ